MRHYEPHERYQYQPWYIKLWRNRFELTVPYWAIKDYLYNFWRPKGQKFRWSFCWSLACGMADAQKGHLLDWNEVLKELK